MRENPFHPLRDALIAMIRAERALARIAGKRGAGPARAAAARAHDAVSVESMRLQLAGVYSGPSETRDADHREAMAAVDAVRWGGE